jgi:chorismate mutase
MDFKNMIEDWVEKKLSDPKTKEEVVAKWNASVNIPILNEKVEEKIFSAIYDSAVAVIKKVLIK